MKRNRPKLELVRTDASLTRPKPDEESRATADSPETEEVPVTRIRVGDVIRARLYQGLPDRVFAREAERLVDGVRDLRIAHIEDTTRPGAHHDWECRVMRSACGRLFTIDRTDWCVRVMAPAPDFHVEVRDAAPLRALPAPNPLHEIIDAEFYDPNAPEGDL